MIHSWQDLCEKFPALDSLSTALRRLPVIRQQGSADCGPACLAMVAAWLGRPIGLDELRSQGFTSPLGWTAREFAAAARQFGLRARALRIETVEQLQASDRPLILHWRFSHFVVLRSLDARGARIVDPVVGELWVERAELERNFTGVALWVEIDPAVAARPTRSHRSAAWTLVWNLVRHSGLAWRLLASAVALQMLALLPALCASYALAALPHGLRSDRFALLALAVVLVCAALLLVGLLRAQLTTLFRARIGVHLSAELADRLLGARYAALAAFPQAELLNRVQAQDEIRDSVANVGIGLALDLLLVLVTAATLFAIDGRSAVLVLGLFGVALLGVLATARARRDRMHRLFIAQAKAGGFAVQLVAGLETLRAAGATTWAAERWTQLAIQRANADTRLGLLESSISVGLQAIGHLGPMAIALLIAAAAAAGGAGLGQALFVHSVGALLFGSLLRVLEAGRALQRLGFQSERVGELLALDQAGQEGAKARLDDAASLQLEDVRFRHASNAPWAVDRVSLQLPSRSFTLLVGASGCGKSTLLSLLAGLLEPQAGRILIDGHVPAAIDGEGSRRPVVMVPQFPYLFAGTLRDNIALARPEADLDAIRAAARLAAIDEDIMQMPMRYDSLVAEGGIGLSGGQRQRVALARAILAHPGVLILDEATSALDGETEARVFANLASLECTRILATHRIGLARLADRVLTLHEGRLVHDSRCGPAPAPVLDAAILPVEPDPSTTEVSPCVS